jgi:peptidoglycan hydrolase-like amidase
MAAFRRGPAAAAVEARGLVLAYQGQIADAFVSTCGGVENVENVFSAAGPVLVGRPRRARRV